MTAGVRAVLHRLRRDERGVAIIEFALSMPLILALGLYGLETANFAIANMRVQQMAMLTADNASRVRTAIDEADINELLIGSKMTGSSIGFAANGRIILSDLEKTTSGNGQYIRWQRCVGAKSFVSSYGTPATLTDTTGNTTTAIGPTGKQIGASANLPVMFVEVSYNYQPIVTNSLLGARVISAVGAFVVRQRTNQVPTNYNSVTTSSCATFAA